MRTKLTKELKQMYEEEYDNILNEYFHGEIKADEKDLKLHLLLINLIQGGE